MRWPSPWSSSSPNPASSSSSSSSSTSAPDAVSDETLPVVSRAAKALDSALDALQQHPPHPPPPPPPVGSDSRNSSNGHGQMTSSSSSSSPSSALSAYTQPQTLLATAILTSVALTSYKLHGRYLRRVATASAMPAGWLRRRSLLGRVTSVGDGDNFRVYHTPGGRLAGWGWLPWKRVPAERRALKDQTVHVRLAGVDAPELAHFGRPSQPGGQAALDWLTAYVGGRRVRVRPWRADQYGRVVATVYMWRALRRRDVGLQMLRAGLATVYEAKTGVEFGDGPRAEATYREAEQWAKRRRKGLWQKGSAGGHGFESPREYKTRHQQLGK